MSSNEDDIVVGDELEKEIVVTWRMRLWRLFEWVPFLERLGVWRWCLCYIASVFLFFGFWFKAWLFWYVMATRARLSASDNPVDYIDLVQNTVVLPDDCPQEMSYEALTSAIFLICNGTLIHVSPCFWCVFNQGHFWAGVMGSGAIFVAALAWAIGSWVVGWAMSLCDESIMEDIRRRRIEMRRRREQAKKEPLISGPHFRSKGKNKKK